VGAGHRRRGRQAGTVGGGGGAGCNGGRGETARLAFRLPLGLASAGLGQGLRGRRGDGQGTAGRSATRRRDRSGAWLPGFGKWGCVFMGLMVLYLSTAGK